VLQPDALQPLLHPLSTDLRFVLVKKASELLLQTCTIQDAAETAVSEHGIVDIQDCIRSGLRVGERDRGRTTGKATVAGTTIRRSNNGLVMEGNATFRPGCAITAYTESGVYAWQDEGGPGEVTVEADVVCEGNNTGNNVNDGNCLARDGGMITGIAAEKIAVHA